MGKTSVKENLKFLLSFESKVSASIKSYNNYLGVLISLINMDSFSDFAIFEIGTNNFHEIGKLVSIIMPQQVIVTNIFPTHLESFRSTRNIAIEKSDIFNLKFNPEIELLILPNSNSDELFLYDQAKKMKISKILTVGKKTNSNYHIQEINKTNKKNIIIKVNKNLVGVNTHFANKIAYHGLSNNLIKEVSNSDIIKPEVFFDKETRFDFLIEKNKQKIFVEVKNVTLFREEKTAEFPDSVTSRGSKHLKTLIDAIKKGYKSYTIFLVQIQGIEYFKIAKDIDNEYYKNYLIAKKAGVNFLAYRCKISPKEIKIEKKLKIIDE